MSLPTGGLSFVRIAPSAARGKRRPTNSKGMSWGLLTSLGGWLIMFFVTQGGIRPWPLLLFAGVFVWTVILRGYSYFKYERGLP